MSTLGPDDDPNVVVGRQHPDDAGVYRMPGQDLLIQTVDIIAPIVNDPFMFGRIACANSLSDVYAMGGRPFAALNIACFPGKKLPLEVLAQTMLGAMETLREAGCAWLGGHTVEDPEFKFGFSVSGIVEGGPPYRIDRAQVGHVLALTKPLGTGVINQSLRRRAISDESAPYLEAQRAMAALNQPFVPAARAADASSATDITGFGLLGHTCQLAKASGVTLEIIKSQVPAFDGVRRLIEEGHVPGRAKQNKAKYGCRVSGLDRFEDSVLFFDPQTSGGILAVLPEDRVDTFITHMGDWEFGVHIIGRVLERGEHDVVLH